MPQDPYVRRCQEVKNYDGDTITCVVDLGWNISVRSDVRLTGLDTPELKAKDPSSHQIASQGKDFVAKWMTEHVAHAGGDKQWPFLLESQALDLYGRALARFFCGQNHCLNDDLLTSGLARPYSGTGPHPWPQ